MILADKIINLRKKNGWSQEELAEKLGVTRQSISKYEGAQSIPDLDKTIGDKMHSIVAKAVFPADQSMICKYSFAISIVTLCTLLSLSLSFSCICDGAYSSSSSSSLIR